MPYTYVISDPKGEQIFWIFMKKNSKKHQKEIRVEKAMKRKGNKLHVKWEGYNNYFNS